MKGKIIIATLLLITASHECNAKILDEPHYGEHITRISGLCTVKSNYDRIDKMFEIEVDATNMQHTLELLIYKENKLVHQDISLTFDKCLEYDMSIWGVGTYDVYVKDESGNLHYIQSVCVKSETSK